MRAWKELQLKCNSNPICRYCGQQLNSKSATVDHLIPLDRGGLSNEDNFGLACSDCNYAKANMTEEEYISFKKGIGPCSHNRNMHLFREQEISMSKAKKDSRYINVDKFFKQYKKQKGV